MSVPGTIHLLAEADLQGLRTRTLERIERRITSSEYKTAAVPFDPKNHVTMRDRRSEFARPIPEIMYQAITN